MSARAVMRMESPVRGLAWRIGTRALWPAAAEPSRLGRSSTWWPLSSPLNSAESSPIQPNQTTGPRNVPRRVTQPVTQGNPAAQSAEAALRQPWRADEKLKITKRTQILTGVIDSPNTIQQHLTSFYARKQVWVRLASFRGGVEQPNRLASLRRVFLPPKIQLALRRVLINLPA